MELINQLFKSVMDQDRAAVVICDTDHNIVYMNPAADKNYAKWGGHDICGKSIFECHNEMSCEMIKKVVAWFGDSPENNIVHTFFNEKQQKDVYMVALRDEEKNLIGYYEKHEYRTKDDMPLYEMK